MLQTSTFFIALFFLQTICAQLTTTDLNYAKQREEQLQEIRSNYIEIQELQLNREQQAINQQRQVNRRNYERNTIKNPENDLRSSACWKINVKVKRKPSKYTVQFLHAPNWVKKKHPNSEMYFTDSRMYADRSRIVFAAYNPMPFTDSINETTIRQIPTAYPATDFGFSCTENLQIDFLKMGYPFEEQGLKVDDKLIAIDNVVIQSKKQLEKQLQLYSVADTVQFIIQRGDKNLAVDINPIKTPANYYGDIEISGFPGYFWTTQQEDFFFGKNERVLQVNSVAFVNGSIFHFLHILDVSEDPKLVDYDFHRFRELILIQLRNIKIKTH